MEIDRLAEAMEQFVNTDDWGEARRTVEQNPGLLSDEAENLLQENIADYRAADREDVAKYLEEHLTILKRSRQVGIEKAFQEAERHARERMEARQRQLDTLRPASPSPLEAAVWQLLEAQSPEEIDRTLANHPELSRDEAALGILDDLMQRARDAGYSEALDYLREYHELLQTVYEMPPIMQTLQQFIVIPTWTESREFLKQHPELLSDEAIQTLDSLVRTAESQGDEPAVKALRTYRDVLQRSRQVGPDKAIEELLQSEEAT